VRQEAESPHMADAVIEARIPAVGSPPSISATCLIPSLPQRGKGLTAAQDSG